MNKRKENESGRSMVEMLGVLAVMALLSVVGILGLRSAMDKHHANEIIYSVSKMETLAKGEFLLHNTFSLSMFNHKTSNGYTVTELVYGNEPIFGIRVSDIPQKVCTQIIELHWKEPKEIAINNVAVTDTSACQEKTTMDFIFAKDENATDYTLERCTTKCSSACDVCQDGVCQKKCTNDESCVYRSDGRQKSSDQTICCPKERVMNGLCCDSVKYDEDTGAKLCCVGSSAHACCPEGEYGILNQCYSCDDPTSHSLKYGTYDARCALCPNRFSTKWYCTLGCPDSRQTMHNGRCLCPIEAPVLLTSNGKCATCDTASSGVWSTNNAPLEIQAVYLDSIHDTCATAAYCGNRRCYGGYDRLCATGKIGTLFNKVNAPKLADGTVAADNTCYACSDIDIATIKLQSQCEICGGTWSGQNWQNGTCPPATN